MAVEYIQGDIFESRAAVLVNPVNCVGTMGGGLALSFSRRFPGMARRYRELCGEGKIRVGTLWLYRAPGGRAVLNFPTKVHWRDPSRAEYVEAGLRKFVAHHERLRIESIAFPALGAGKGRLDFEREVRPLVERYLRPLPVAVEVYLPHEARGNP